MTNSANTNSYNKVLLIWGMWYSNKHNKKPPCPSQEGIQLQNIAETICYQQLFHHDINFIWLPYVTGKRETYMKMYGSW